MTPIPLIYNNRLLLINIGKLMRVIMRFKNGKQHQDIKVKKPRPIKIDRQQLDLLTVV